ncbi:MULTISPECIES: DUF305 domain-containing protein [unclassified Arthrobacter]|uniref:DUF305 domain-containing protein n=1 Tax=unclassified Arthrobacter TaxID=235627 RepID=UPI0014920B95|nr:MULTISPECIES: DUF305 domain-containing protein [unclassified Arthrobacter]MBE0010161.1 DUF305 domain-containing protein [Arthrobacter sp. AET 35A]NOJ64056.1 DUF305 domain-containing protein [Arthrobacter sp. 147(2020)]
MKRYLSLSALSVAAIVTLAGCGSDTTSSTPGAEPTASTQEMTVSTEPGTEVSAEHNEADVMFAQMMIPHHQQAVEMSEMMLTKNDVSSDVVDLATQIKDAQGPEIETMTGWLEAWDEPVEPEGGMEGHDMGSMGGMDGMMDADQMADLESAEGDDAARMFLESMTEHHNGAVDMAQEEIDNGENPEAIALAETIVETQQAEIQEMEALLAEL